MGCALKDARQLWAQFEDLGAARTQNWREHALQAPRAKIERAWQVRTCIDADRFCGAGAKVGTGTAEARPPSRDVLPNACVNECVRKLRDSLCAVRAAQ